MRQFVVGFAMDEHKQYVVLIKKTHPAWQAGKLNGVGGHVYPGEAAEGAMEREFEEEAGVLLKGWKRYAEVTYLEAQVHFYRIFIDIGLLVEVKTQTDEEIVIRRLDQFDQWKGDLIPNLQYLIPLAVDGDLGLEALITVPR